MRLEMVSIKKFRSIESIQLVNCGRFNVLIGKNNSGKSNILSGIASFFACLRPDSVASLSPPIGKEIDFFDKKAELPIEITLTFSLPLAERDALIRDIVTESPRMKNAVDGLDPELRLSITVTIIRQNEKPFSFVSNLALGGTARPGSQNLDPERVLLRIGKAAALEICNELSRSRQHRERVEQIRTIQRQFVDSGMFSFVKDRMVEREGRPPRPIRSLLKDLPFDFANSQTMEIVAPLILKSSTPEELSKEIDALLTGIEEEPVQQEPLRNKIDTFSGEESSVPQYAQNLLRKISELTILHLTERRTPIGKNEAQLLLSLKVRRGGPEILRNIQGTIAALLGVQVDAFESGASSLRRSEATAEMDVDNFLVEVNGSGIREALRLVLDLEFRHPHILLVEEPEMHLHAALETSMMQYLKRKSENLQVFVTTHSTNFLDTAEMKNVYLVSKPDSTKVKLLDFEEVETHIPRELGIRLSSFFMFDSLVFVEGISDEHILREWASTLGINFSRATVGFIHMGSARNFTHFATESTLSFMAKRQVKMWFLLDRDEKNDSEIRKLQEAVGENAVVKFLEKREIENYLVCPHAIIEFIKLKKDLSGNRTMEELPSESVIKKTIEESAEELKQTAINKRVAKILCKPVYPSRNLIHGGAPETNISNKITEEINKLISQLEETRNRVESVHKEQCESIEGAWQERKLAIVPGDLLLDSICKKYGVRFKKEDGVRLAALMQESEIHDEIKEIIRSIETGKISSRVGAHVG